MDSLSIEAHIYRIIHNVYHKYNKGFLSSIYIAKYVLRKTLKPSVEKQVQDIFTKEKMYVTNTLILKEMQTQTMINV